MSSKMVRSEGLGLSRECNVSGKIYWKLYKVLSYLGVVYPLYLLYFKLSCVYGCLLSCVSCCSCLGCIVVLLYYGCIVATLCVLIVYMCVLLLLL
jgi:hypothetical protein